MGLPIPNFYLIIILFEVANLNLFYLDSNFCLTHKKYLLIIGINLNIL